MSTLLQTELAALVFFIFMNKVGSNIIIKTIKKKILKNIFMIFDPFLTLGYVEMIKVFFAPHQRSPLPSPLSPNI